MKIFGYWTLLIALLISVVAAYYSIIGLTAIFAAAIIPIIIMGSALEVAKVTTAVWLHRYWHQAPFLMKTYLTTATVVLMFITSMGIFGFLSSAHVEQTSAANESVAQLERIEVELSRNNAIIDRAEQRIVKAESSTGNRNDDIQEQISAEQERISSAYARVQPAIDEQTQIIEDTRSNDANRTKPYEDQLASIQAEVLRLETSAREYEDSITGLDTDNSAVEPLFAQIANLEAEIIRVTNQLNSGERDQIRAGQAIIGVSNDGLFGGNTRTALAAWVSGQRERIAQIQSEVSQVRQNAQTTVDSERERLAGVVNTIRTTQIPALKEREIAMLEKIEQVRAEESPIITNARQEIARIRQSVDQQIAASNQLIAQLRDQIKIDGGEEIDTVIEEQQQKIREANNVIDTLTEQKYSLEAQTRKLEAEVGPVKYIAELVYGEVTDKNTLEEAVRWVIILLVAVFDPLAIILVLAGVMTINEFGRRESPTVKKTVPEVEPTGEEQQEQLTPDNTPQPEVKTDLSEDAPEDQEKIRKPAKSDAGETPKRIKKDNPDNSWLNT